MGIIDKFLKVPESPTIPGKSKTQEKFDVANLLKGPLQTEESVSEKKIVPTNR